MKKILLTLAAVAALALPASAAQFTSTSFLPGLGFVQLGSTSNLLSGTSARYVRSRSTAPVTVSTNGVVTFHADITNAVSGLSAPLWVNADGTAPNANVSVRLQGKSASATNVVTFKLTALPTQDGWAPTAAQNAWSFSATANGTNEVSLATNVPTALLQGCAAVQLSVTNGATGDVVLLREANLNGYK